MKLHDRAFSTFFSVYSSIFLTSFYPSLCPISVADFLAQPAHQASELGLLSHADAHAMGWEAFETAVASTRLRSHRDFVYKGAVTMWAQQLKRTGGSEEALIGTLCDEMKKNWVLEQPSEPSMAALFFSLEFFTVADLMHSQLVKDFECPVLDLLPGMIAKCFQSLTQLSGQSHVRQGVEVKGGVVEKESVEVKESIEEVKENEEVKDNSETQLKAHNIPTTTTATQ